MRNKLQSLGFLHLVNFVTIPWHVGLCGFEAYLMGRPHGIVPTNGVYCIEESDTIKFKYLSYDIRIIDYVYFHKI